jgi:PBP1b-binding outer membrane lipoprotein LpoB
MRKMLAVTMALLVALCFIYGCGKKETKEDDKVPAETKQAEMADTTAMDSATWEEGAMDTMAGGHEHDSM